MSNELTSNVAMKELRLGYKLNEMQGCLNHIEHVRMKALRYGVSCNVKEFNEKKDELVDKLIARYESLKKDVVKSMREVYKERFGEAKSLGAKCDNAIDAKNYYIYETGFINHVSVADDVKIDFTKCKNFLSLDDALKSHKDNNAANSYLMRFRIRNVSGLYVIEGDIWDDDLGEFDFSYYLFTV